MAKERKGKERKLLPPIIPLGGDTAKNDVDKELGEIFKAVDENIAKLNQLNTSMVMDMVDTYGAPAVMEAVKIAVKRGKRSISYIEGVCKNNGRFRTNKSGGSKSEQATGEELAELESTKQQYGDNER